MPVLKQKIIRRADLRANPDVLYIFGDNDKRYCSAGQAAECRGEENAIGVRTKWEPSMKEHAFFDDEDFHVITAMIDMDLEPAFEHSQSGGIVVIPADSLGTGFARLDEKAPQVFEYLQAQLSALEAE